jgi:hypothetical protein
MTLPNRGRCLCLATGGNPPVTARNEIESHHPIDSVLRKRTGASNRALRPRNIRYAKTLSCPLMELVSVPEQGGIWPISSASSLGLIIWLVVMFQAQQRKLFHLPVVGWVTERLV